MFDIMVTYAIKLVTATMVTLGYIALAVNENLPTGSGDPIPAWLNVGAATIAVGGVVYLVKLVVKGDLVPEKRLKSVIKETVDEYIKETR